MRVKGANFSPDSGGVLIVTLLLCVVLGILIGSYLSLAKAQHLSAARSESWNRALIVAEAGVEEAMAHLNSGVTTNNLAVNSWTDAGGGNYRKTNYVGASYSLVTIKIPPAATNPYPLVVSRSYVPGPISTPTVSRTVQVNTKQKPAMGVSRGMVVLTTINLKGSGVAMDSFDSSNTNYSTRGLYDSKKARDQAQAATLSGATNAITVDNGSIKGMVRTGPGGQVGIGSNGSVGDANWVSSGQPGIESGHFRDDVNFSFSDVSLPPIQSWLPPAPGKYKINGVPYKYVLDNTSAWTVAKLADSVYVNGKDVILYVTGDMSLGSGMEIRLAPGASLKLYVGAASATIGGNGIVNGSGQAKDFIYYGLPSNINFSLAANAAFVGQINAPAADFTLGGGGKNTYDFIGACLAKSVTMNGHFNFHYDESLMNTPAPTGFVATSWDEL